MKLIVNIILVFVFTNILNAEPIPGNYESLLIAVNKAEKTVSGFYENYTGWDESLGTPRFSCIFYLKGSTDPQTQQNNIKTWFPSMQDPEAVISGSLSQAENQNNLYIKLNKEHGGCWNVEHFAGEKKAMFNLVKRTDWIDIKIVSSEKAYFHKKPDNKSMRKAYVIKNDVLKINKKHIGWLYAEHKNNSGNITKGWIQKKDVFPIYHYP